MEIGNVAEHAYTVSLNEQAAEGIWRMRIDTEAARLIAPGQFMNFHVPGDGAHILRIPLSFSFADAERGYIELIYAVVGEGTERLSRMRVGDSSTLLGPLGKGWALPEKPGRAVLVAGGVGLPPVLAAARMLAEAGIGFDMVVGARTQAMHVYPEVEDALRFTPDGMSGRSCPEYDPDRRVILTTDDGTSSTGDGIARYATDGMEELLQDRTYAQVYTCGPTPMMAGVARLAAKYGISCQASMERMMGCGFGACACCNVELAKGGYALCCQDGPVFEAEEVAW